MDIMTIDRIYQDDSTVGILTFKKFRCFTLELPQNGNQRNISCIPEGQYKCRKITSPSLGPCIDVLNVPGRSYIRIHKGNFTSQILGCILVGSSLNDINHDNIIDVTNSKSTLADLLNAVPKAFDLVIL